MKICKKCNLELEDSQFYRNGAYLLSSCRKCLNKSRLEYQNSYRKDNLEKVKIWNKNSKQKAFSDETKKEKIREQKRNSNKKNVVHCLWKRTKDRAIKKGLDFDLIESEIIIPELCPILEIPIFVGTKGDYNNSPTIDRIDNSKGYTKDNVKIISMLANTMKNSASIENLKKFSKNILNYIK